MHLWTLVIALVGGMAHAQEHVGSMVPIHFPANFDAEARHWIASQAVRHGHALGVHENGVAVLMNGATRTARVQNEAFADALFDMGKPWMETDWNVTGVKKWLTVAGGLNAATTDNCASGPLRLVKQTLSEVAMMPGARQIIFDPGVKFGMTGRAKIGVESLVVEEIVVQRSPIFGGGSRFHPSVAAIDQVLTPTGNMLEVRFPSVNGEITDEHSALIRRLVNGELHPSSPELSQFVRPSGSVTRSQMRTLLDSVGRVPIARFGILTGASFAVDWAVYRGTMAVTGSEGWAQFASNTTGVMTSAAIEHVIFGTPWMQAFGTTTTWAGSGRLAASGTSIAGLGSVVFLGVQVNMMAYEVNRGIYARINEPGFDGFTPEERDAWLAHPSTGWQYASDALRGYGRALARTYGGGN